MIPPKEEKDSMHAKEDKNNNITRMLQIQNYKKS
jgi:hypothetical protein